MSSTLVWKPAAKENSHSLSDELKFILKKSFLDDGSAESAIVNYVGLDYLSGLKDAGIKDAQILIDAIEKYKEIEISLKY